VEAQNLENKLLAQELFKNFPLKVKDDDDKKSKSENTYARRLRKSSVQPFQVMLSRERRENALKKKSSSSTAKAYNPKYDLVER